MRPRRILWAKERLIDAADPVFIDGKYDDHGKWMDGWESRRKRTPGHDYCILRLGTPGLIHGVDIDTNHFTGNFPPQASLDACVADADMPGDDAWWPVLDTVDLRGDAHHYHELAADRVVTHLRLNIYPDGGVARLRVFGEIRPTFDGREDERIDLVALENGGRAVICNDEHYGSMHNLNLEGRGVNMGDGWETARRRVPGNDWVVLALGARGVLDEAVIDTAHFKGNYPDRAMLQAAAVTGPTTPDELARQSEEWPVLMSERKLSADAEHRFSDLRDTGPVTHVRLSIFPDGGVSRLRLFGRLDGST